MTLDARRAQLWQAMGLGPIYRLRSELDEAQVNVRVVQKSECACAHSVQSDARQ